MKTSSLIACLGLLAGCAATAASPTGARGAPPAGARVASAVTSPGGSPVASSGAIRSASAVTSPAASPVAPPAASPVAPPTAAPSAAATDWYGDYPSRPDVREFIVSLADRHGFDSNALAAMFAGVQRSDDAIRLMTPAPRSFKKSWKAYRARFIDNARISAGVRFWEENADTVKRASV
ncbi:MAG: lytic murein transglycosylase, partial [Gammaproteobacteria bacterium]